MIEFVVAERYLHLGANQPRKVLNDLLRDLRRIASERHRIEVVRAVKPPRLFVGRRDAVRPAREVSQGNDDDGPTRRVDQQEQLGQHAIAYEVKRVVELRKKGDPDFELSERGGLTGQFHRSGAGVYEVMLAHWLYTAKQPDVVRARGGMPFGCWDGHFFIFRQGGPTV